MKSYSLMIPGNSDAVQLLRALKGAPLACLIALHLAHPQPLGREQLAHMTAYKKDAITEAMNVLVGVYHFAARTARYVAWVLTDTGVRQMQLPVFSALLPENPTRAPIEGDFSALPSSSSSSFIVPESISDSLKTTTTTENEGGKTALEPLPEHLQEFLESNLMLGCPREHAAAVLRDAMQAWTPLVVECEATLWVLYCESPLGNGINLPPARFAMTKLQKREKAPDFFHRRNQNDPRYGTHWDRWSTHFEAEIRRVKFLLKECYDYEFRLGD